MSDSENRLVVVSNRLPVKLEPREDEWAVQPGSGGLVTALEPILDQRGGLWIGWPGTSEKADIQKPLESYCAKKAYDLQPVMLSSEEVDNYYYGFSNEVLWPLFHDFHSRCKFKQEYWDVYQKVNNKFAQQISQACKEDDTIWVHDYHLLCVAQKLKELGLHQKCGFFLHIPFPSPDIFCKLPWRFEILKSLTEYDLLGLQTWHDVQNFLICLERLDFNFNIQENKQIASLELSNKQIKVGAFPISIDFDHFANYPAAEEEQHLISNLYNPGQNGQIMLGVDRLDYSKGIPSRFEAVHTALSKYPDLKGKLSLIQIVVPSREHIPEYQQLKEEIERLVGEINGEFTTPDWLPIYYLYTHLPRQELLAYYRAADIALITPLRDGMNLVAKEYCAAQREENGVLILSEFAGTAAELSENALLVNPYDILQTADAIHHAFYMQTGERQTRMKFLRKTIKEKDIHHWVSSFLSALHA